MVSCHEEALSKKRFHRVLLTRHTSYKAVCCVLRSEQWNTTPVTDLARTSWNMLTHTSVALPSVHILIKHKSWPSVIMARSEVTVIVGQPLNTANCSLYALFQSWESWFRSVLVLVTFHRTDRGPSKISLVVLELVGMEPRAWHDLRPIWHHTQPIMHSSAVWNLIMLSFLSLATL